jgi:glycosyltransferase involved in cell wall biosynthesis
MRLLLSINSLSSGGAERVMAKLANHLHGEHDVSVVTQVATGSDQYPTQARRLSLEAGAVSKHAWQALTNNITRWYRLRRVIKENKPDCVITFMPTANILALLATLGSATPVVVSERVHPPYTFLGPVRGWLQRRLYPLAKRVVVLTEESAAWMRNKQNIHRVAVIPNSISLPLPCSEPILDPETCLPAGKKLILAVGRLVDQKQHDVVLRAFAQTAQDPSWHLVVVGVGPNEQALKELATDLGITNRCNLIPRIGNIQVWYERAEIYVSASAYEGFPNALLEAMACRCAVIAFDCPTGPADIISNGEDGLLIPLNDTARFQQALSSLQKDSDTRKSLANKAADVLDRHSDTQFFASWDKVITAAVNS